MGPHAAIRESSTTSVSASRTDHEGRAPPQTALVGGTLIDGCGSPPLQDAVLVIEDGLLAQIGGPATPVPQGAQVLDVRGGYVIPGLMDAGVNLLFDISPLPLIRYEGRYDEVAIEAAQLALRSGFTSVFSRMGPRPDLVKARDAIRSGRVAGPRVYVAGNLLGLGGPFSADQFQPQGSAGMEAFRARIDARWEEGTGAELAERTPDEIARIVEAYIQGGGLDFLAYIVSPAPGALRFSQRQQRALVEAAHGAGVPVQCIPGSVEGIHMALDAGADALHRLNLTGWSQGLPGQTIESIVARAVPWSCEPITAQRLADYRSRLDKEPVLRAADLADRNLRALLPAAVSGLVLATEAGIVGADFLNSSLWSGYFPPEDGQRRIGMAHLYWMRALQEMGVAPMAILLAATRNVARAHRVADRLGTLEPGKLADLLVLANDPLHSWEHYRDIQHVMIGGQLIDTALLPSHPLMTARVAQDGGQPQ